MKKNLAARLLLILLLTYTIYQLGSKLVPKEKSLHDFSGPYYAAKAYSHNENPYDTNVLSKMAQKELPYYLPFIYPPFTLLFFRFFSFFDYNKACLLFLCLKYIALFIILYLWRNKFINKSVDIYFYLFCLLAFDGTIFIDLGAGNVSILEQVLLWTGFYFLIRDKLWIFSIFIILAASFKIIPILFLGILLFTDNKHRFAHFLSASVLFLGILLTTYLLSPKLFINFIVNAILGSEFPWERGMINPATFPLLKDLTGLFMKNTSLPVPYICVFSSYLTLVMIILSISCYAFIKSRRLKIDEDEKEKIKIFLFCVTYALIVPRFKDYSYILLIPPTYYIIRKVVYLKPYPLLFALVIIPCLNTRIPGFGTFFAILRVYYPLFVAYCVWGLYLYEIFKLPQDNGLVSK